MSYVQRLCAFLYLAYLPSLSQSQHNIPSRHRYFLLTILIYFSCTQPLVLQQPQPISDNSSSSLFIGSTSPKYQHPFNFLQQNFHLHLHERQFVFFCIHVILSTLFLLCDNTLFVSKPTTHFTSSPHQLHFKFLQVDMHLDALQVSLSSWWILSHQKAQWKRKWSI